MTLYPSLPYPLCTYCIMTYFSLFLVTTFLTFLSFPFLAGVCMLLRHTTSYLRPRLPIVSLCSILMFMTILILGTLLFLLIRVDIIVQRRHHIHTLTLTQALPTRNPRSTSRMLPNPSCSTFRISNAHNSTTPAPNTPLKFTRFPRNKPLALSHTCSRMQHVPNVNIFLLVRLKCALTLPMHAPYCR